MAKASASSVAGSQCLKDYILAHLTPSIFDQLHINSAPRKRGIQLIPALMQQILRSIPSFRGNKQLIVAGFMAKACFSLNHVFFWICLDKK